MSRRALVAVLMAVAFLAVGCGSDDGGGATAKVTIENDFDNPDLPFQPPWTICEASYNGVEFGTIAYGGKSNEFEVPVGLDYVLMVAAWDDPECKPENCLPIATKNEEEVVDGQTRTIVIGLTNHQGACPPEGTAPIPEAQYNRIVQLWPDYNFKPYAERTQNTQCLSE